MSKRSKVNVGRSKKVGNAGESSYRDMDVDRSPLSNISNIISTNNNVFDIYKESRKNRKLQMENRRSNSASTSSNAKHAQSSSNLVLNSTNDTQNTSSATPLTRNNLNIAGPSSNRSTLTTLRPSIPRAAKSRRFLSPIPMANLTSEEQPNITDVARDPFNGICTDYLDHGDQYVKCDMCHAKLWKNEAANVQTVLGRRTYMLCCAYGKVELPPYKDTCPNYQSLFKSNDYRSKHFLKNIRRYNSMFCFTSMGGKVDSKINNGSAPFIFRISGQNYHTMGSLLPDNGKKPQFSQLYIYDTENEICNRQTIFSDSKNQSSTAITEVDTELIQYLKLMLDSNNELVKSYRMVRDCFSENPDVKVRLRLIKERGTDGRTYNLPTASEVAALIVGDIADLIDNRDVIVETQSGMLKRISELHPAYLPLQYPLLFPYGEDGYRTDVLHRQGTASKKKPNSKVTMRQFFAYRFQDRDNSFSLILNARRLLQQLLVDAYTMVESERLFFIRRKQNELRCESYQNLHKIQSDTNTNMANVGKRIILPSSFTGGARYMMQNYLDAMSLCKWYGYPDYFVTITCNPKWPEISRFLKDKSIRPEDRPDILCRLFKLKLDSIMKDFKEKSIFGKTSAAVYTVEFQKRGLPHAHICLFIDHEHKLASVEHVDPIISAEIPDQTSDLELYRLVSEFMIHGPCGHANMNSPCMRDGKCSKNFPKKFSSNTTIDGNGYPIYRRRDTGNFVEKSGVQLDNRSVVPYNSTLLRRYQAHINVEWCNQSGSIKYLFKYINKGPDMSTVAIEQSHGESDTVPTKDEIKEHYDCRYVSACEASWRIFKFDVHYRFPSVMRLPFHLPGQQSVIFGPDDEIDAVLNKPSVNSSMFLGWMERNKLEDPIAHELTYVEFPTKYVWKADKREWHPCKQGKTIGRIHSISPAFEDPYYLRILLNKVRGPKSFDDIKTVNGIVYDSFRDTCYALGLLDDDKEYIEAIKEANDSATGPYLRNLFATMLLCNTLSMPEKVWEETWRILADGILQKQQQILNLPANVILPDHHIQNLTLYEIEKYLMSNNSSLRRIPSMPYPDTDLLASTANRLIADELSYDVSVLQTEYENQVASLTNEQRLVFDEIIKGVECDKGGIFFVYGYGGTGKTFLWKTLSAAIRSRGQIVLNVASSGIASLLLSGGRTAHSRFHIPLNLTEDSLCHILPGSDVANLLKETKLIIWDEAPMIHKHALEALDRSMKDIFKSECPMNSELPFGGKVMVFGGDFRQVLPVVPNGSRQQIVNSAICSSYIWSTCKVLRLTKNMRLTVGQEISDIQETESFAKWLLEIGEGNIGGIHDGEAIVEIPEDLLISQSADPLASLIEFVYPSVVNNYKHKDFFSERAILAPTNEVVEEINDRMLSVLPGEEMEYLSSDNICKTEFQNDPLQQNAYSPDVLNGLKISGLPNHRLVLKVGAPVMLLRNIDQQNGLCNGTRLRITSLKKRVIEAEIISGGNIGTRTYIPRINLIPSDNKIPFKFQRRQFPISVCFAMTINKSQGQSLSRVGLYLKYPVFTHGQLYVALSRVKTRSGVKLLILDSEGNVTNKTTNVVYKEIFRDL